MKPEHRLDRYFSKYIRLRDTNENLYGNCITCAKRVHFSEAQCGHYFSRKYFSTRWEEWNAWLQCQECNELNDGMDEAYLEVLQENLGEDFMAAGLILSKQVFKVDKFWYKEKIEYYKEAIKLLEQIKRLGGETPKELFEFDIPKIDFTPFS